LTPRGRRAGRPSVQQGSYHRHGLRRSPGHLCSWLGSCMPLGTGLPRTRRPSTAAPHPHPPRPDDAPRLASIAGGAAERALVCDEGLGALPGSGKARVARVAHAETARVRPGAEPLPCVGPRRRVADSQAVSRLCPTPRRGGASRARKPRAAAVGSGRPAEAKGAPRSSRPRRPYLRHDVDFDGDADDVDVDCVRWSPPHLPLFIIL
jgi:hypothetical protein